MQSPCSWGDSRLVWAKRRCYPIWSPFSSPSPNSSPLQCSWADLHRLCWNLHGKPMPSTQPALEQWFSRCGARLPASVSPRKLLKMHILRLIPDTKSKFLAICILRSLTSDSVWQPLTQKIFCPYFTVNSFFSQSQRLLGFQFQDGLSPKAP